MSNHVTEWLNAYFDGELAGRRLHQVEEHLAECGTCQAELESLRSLSELLHEVPVPEFTSVERFAARVSLRLPHPKAEAPRKKILEVGWWMIPVGLLAIWIVMNASFFVYDMLSVANSFGWLTSVSDWMRFGTSSAADWSSALGQIGILRGNALTLAASTETFTRISLLQITLQVSIALLYLSWIAIWWARHMRHQTHQRGRPLEG
jgi:hypothetical protein